MIIEAPDIFRQWLTAVLEPLCDAEPAALARYVHALVKKDKPAEELKATMIDQLDVFLQTETQSFVALLFKTLDNKEYLNYKKEEPVKEEPTTTAEPVVAQQPEVTVPVPNATETTIITSSHNALLAEKDLQIQSSVVSDSTTKSDHDKREEKPTRPRLNRDYINKERSRSRSRSRSPWERDPQQPANRPNRSGRSRDRDRRDRDREREKRGSYRSPAPPGVHHRRYDRRYSRSPSPGRGYRGGTSRSKSRSPRPRNRYRSRSRSLSYGGIEKKRKLSPSKDVDVRPVQPPATRRCRDYELKGFCMAGDLCPDDHGSDPVVVNDLPLPLLGFGPPTLAPPPTMIPPPPFGPRPPMLAGAANGRGMRMGGVTLAEYNPDAPALNPQMNWGRPPFHMSRGMHHHGPRGHYNQRDLIPVPVQSGRGGPGGNQNCCLDILKIPVPLNNITHLNNHFAKFGKIVNIQVNYNDDPEAAMITFSNPAEAYAAYRSTEAVLNNRFIRVVWHGKDRHKNQNEAEKEIGGSKETETKKVTSEEEKAKQLAAIKENQTMLEKNILIRQKTEDTLKKKVEIATELQKRSAQLMEKQIEQQKDLLKKLESGGLDEKQKVIIKETIKTLQESIEKIRKDLLAAKKPPKKTREEIEKEILDTDLDLIARQQEGGDLVPLQKKLTQLKLELAKFEPKPVPVSPKLMMIKTATSIIKNPTVYGSRHHFNSQHLKFVRNQKAGAGKAVVDHRPTRLLVSGYEQDEKDKVLAHFRGFGELLDYISDDSTPSIVLNFKTRAEAEIAMANGKNFQDRTLTVTWYNPNQIGNRRQSSASGPTYHMHAGRQVLLSGSENENEPIETPDNESEGEHIPDSSDDLLLQDDDEEGEDEERSWRR